MPRPCVICASPHRNTYEKMYLEDRMRVRDIWKIAIREPYNEKISYTSFLRHIRQHVDLYIKQMEASDRVRKELYTKILRDTLTTGRQLSDNLANLNMLIQQTMKKGTLAEADAKLLISLCAETRMTVETLFKWQDKIQWTEPKREQELIEEMCQFFLQLTEDIPVEYQIKIKERLEQYVRDRATVKAS